MLIATERDLKVNNSNERVIVVNMWTYWAHLSIYRFAMDYCRGKTVLDAGSGSGYGAAYLAENGANVVALEIDPDAVDYSRSRYQRFADIFTVTDLNQPLALPDRHFDVVFSSNVFEHIPNVNGLAAECARIVKSDGTLIVAVPPITLPWIAEDDMLNYWHVHHLPPAAWHAKLSRFFADITCFGHAGRGDWGKADVQDAEIHRRPENVTIRETDFEFPPVTIGQLNSWQCITAIFVCRRPRSEALPETVAERMPADWFEGAMTAKLIRQERTRAETAEKHLSKILSTRAWRSLYRLYRAVKWIRRYNPRHKPGPVATAENDSYSLRNPPLTPSTILANSSTTISDKV